MAEWIIDDEWVDDEALGLAEMTGKATELIRCKDCKYCTEQWANYTYYVCERPFYKYATELNDFCSWAERKEE